MTYDAISNAPKDALNAFRAVQDWHMKRAMTRSTLLTENLRRQEMTQRMQMLHQRYGLEERALGIRQLRAQTDALEARQRMEFDQEGQQDARLKRLEPGRYVPSGKDKASQLVIDPSTGRPKLRSITDPAELKKALESIEQRRTRPEREMQQRQARIDLNGADPALTLDRLTRNLKGLQNAMLSMSEEEQQKFKKIEQRLIDSIDTVSRALQSRSGDAAPQEPQGLNMWEQIAKQAEQAAKAAVKLQAGTNKPSATQGYPKDLPKGDNWRAAYDKAKAAGKAAEFMAELKKRRK